MTDLRLLPALVATWVAALIGPRLSEAWWVGLAAAVTAVAGVVAVCGRSPQRWAVVAAAGCGAASLVGAGARVEVRDGSELRRLAERRAEVRLVAVVTGDPVRLDGRVRGAHRVPGGIVLSTRVERVSVGPDGWRLRHPVTVLADDPVWSTLLPGARVELAARLGAPRPGDRVAAVARAHGPPLSATAPGVVQRAAGRLRAGLRAASDGLPRDARGLLPGLVIGDTSRLPDDLREDFRGTGMTHLVAVSGSNAALFLGLALLLTRRAGAPVGVTVAVGLLALVFFVVLARPSPSVLRAAVMGGVALIALVTGRGRSGLSALLGAALLLVLLDPDLASSAGFALSSAATAGLVVLAPRWRVRLAERLPSWLADAIAVPLAAQVACLPVLVGLFGRLSLVAVPANLLAMPAVGLATVAGVASALLAPLSMPAARAVAWCASLPTLWLAQVARRLSGVPLGEVSWPTGWAGAGAMAALLLAGPRAWRRRPVRRGMSAGLAGVLAVVVTTRVVTPGWPPPGWVLVVCDVGQGDGLVVRGRHAVLVVDTGPDPDVMRRCLDDLGVRRISALVLTHLHADHVEGLPGALRGRAVGEVVTGPLDEPAEEWARVQRWAAERRVPIRRSGAGERWQTGDVDVRVLGPAAAFRGTESDPNNSSVVLAVSVRGLRLLLTGDVEQPAQRALLAGVPAELLRAEVLKTAHHGSARQVEGFAAAVGASVAVTSVGADNPYGHPARTTMSALGSLGVLSMRTDRHGDVVVGRRDDGGVYAVARRSRLGSARGASRPSAPTSTALRRQARPDLFCRVPRGPPRSRAILSGCRPPP